MDTQGFEPYVLAGASGIMSQVELIELELSIRELYEGQQLYLEQLAKLEDDGYRLIWIDRGFLHSTTEELLQFNAILRRAS
jgi:hypothetical protein